jgi:hypothetical protein
VVEEDDDKGPVVRCRMCGAKVAHKQYVAALWILLTTIIEC